MGPVIQAIYLFIYFIFKSLCNFYVNVPVTYLLILLYYPLKKACLANRNIVQIVVTYIFLLYVFRLLCLSLNAVRIIRSV